MMRRKEGSSGQAGEEGARMMKVSRGAVAGCGDNAGEANDADCVRLKMNFWQRSGGVKVRV